MRNLPSTEHISACREEFATGIKEIHDQVRMQLQRNTKKYKVEDDRIKRDVQFQVGDMVWTNLKRERLPKGIHTKLMMRRVGLCQILKKFGNNAYEIQLPSDISISPIFNVANLTPFEGAGKEDGTFLVEDVADILKDFPSQGPPKIEGSWTPML